VELQAALDWGGLALAPRLGMRRSVIRGVQELKEGGCVVLFDIMMPRSDKIALGGHERIILKSHEINGEAFDRADNVHHRSCDPNCLGGDRRFRLAALTLRSYRVHKKIFLHFRSLCERIGGGSPKFRERT
jgi:hypothetical protein